MKKIVVCLFLINLIFPLNVFASVFLNDIFVTSRTNENSRIIHIDHTTGVQTEVPNTLGNFVNPYSLGINSLGNPLPSISKISLINTN